MIDKLNTIDFPWEREDWFTPFYEKLIAYKKSHNGSFEGVLMNKEIGTTVNRIRQAKKGKGGINLTEEMAEKLEAIGFPWEVEKVDWFTPFYEKLIEYKQKHNGSFVGAVTDKEIGGTVGSIRKAKKGKGTYKLTDEMMEKLDAIDFPWEREDWFTSFYEKLIEYRDNEIKDKNGNIKKPKGSFAGVATDKEIGGTVGAIRQAKKGKGKCKLTDEMIDKLDVIGFPWEGRTKKVQEYDLSV